MNALMLSVSLASGGGVTSQPPPEGDLPADAFQEPEATGDGGYFRFTNQGYFLEPLP